MSHLYCAVLRQHQCNPFGEPYAVNTDVWNITQKSGIFFYLQKVGGTDLWKSRFRSGLCLKGKTEENRKIIEEMVCMFAHTHMAHTDSSRTAMANSALPCPHNILTGLREIWGLAQDVFLLARVAYDVAGFRHVWIALWPLCHKNPLDLKYMSKIIWGLWRLLTSSKLWSASEGFLLEQTAGYGYKFSTSENEKNTEAVQHSQGDTWQAKSSPGLPL